MLTVIRPVVAPAGTLTTKTFDVADWTPAVLPLNFTVFSAATALKPEP
nr:hypothetical protein [Ideonella sp.]